MAVTLDLTPASDPAYLAFMRSQGIQESEASGEIQRRIAALNRGLSMRLPDYTEQEKRGQEGIAGGFESRGVFRSGARLVAQQRLTNDTNQARLGDVANTQDNIAQANGDLARQVAALRRSSAEQELASRGNLTAGYPGGSF